jgi:EmrB/QacA subfamily drug resistance transporter
MAGLHTNVTVGLWTLTAYIITSTVFLLPAGRWADARGYRRIFLLGFLVFTVATALSGLAPTGAALIAARLVQGGGAALALATATPLIVRAFPPNELGRALGINSTAWVIGSIVGPVAGGALVSAWGWRWVFFVTVPFALAGIVGAWRLLPDSRGSGRLGSDTPGMITFGAALTLLLVVLSEAQAWGWTAPRTIGAFALSAVGFLLFLRLEQRTPHPLFDLALFRHPHYRSGIAVTLAYAVGYFATTFLLTLYLQGALHLSPLVAGLMLVPLSVPQLVMAPVGGMLADRFGPARPVLLGLLGLALGTDLLSDLPTHLAAWAVMGPLLVMSTANGLSWPSLTKAVMASAPPTRTGVASGMFYTVRNTGMALSLTLALVIGEAALPPAVAARAFLGRAGLVRGTLAVALVHATHAGFHVFMACFLVAFFAGWGLLARRVGQVKPAAEVDLPG